MGISVSRERRYYNPALRARAAKWEPRARLANDTHSNLYLYKIESQNLDTSVLIVQQSEALYIICRRIQHGMESDMG